MSENNGFIMKILDEKISNEEYMMLLEYIHNRESAAWERGYNSAKNLYEPLIFSDKVEV